MRSIWYPWEYRILHVTRINHDLLGLLGSEWLTRQM
jgi:hypothetical protein